MRDRTICGQDADGTLDVAFKRPLTSYHNRTRQMSADCWRNQRGFPREFLALGRKRAHDRILRRLNRKECRERRESRKEERGLALAAGSLLRPGKPVQLKPRIGRTCAHNSVMSFIGSFLCVLCVLCGHSLRRLKAVQPKNAQSKLPLRAAEY